MNQTWKIVVAVIITAIIVGGGVYLWQQQKVTETPQVVPKVEVPISEVPEVVPATSTNLVLSNNDPECTLGLESRGDIGGYKWPTHNLYRSYGIGLGELFTAMACGEKRVQEITSGKTKTEVGYYINIYPAPSEDFRKTLINIGFEFVKKGYKQECTFPKGVPQVLDTSKPDDSCVLVDIPETLHEEWKLTKSVLISTLYPLRKYTNESWDADTGALQ